MAAMMKSFYDDLNYLEGTYFAKAIAIEKNVNLENFEVVVSEGKIVKISFANSVYFPDAQGYVNMGDIVIDNIGTTEVVLPNDENANKMLSVSGKSFVFSEAIAINVSDDEKNEVVEHNQGLTVTFSSDGTVTSGPQDGSMVESGTYTQNGYVISITFTSITMPDENGDMKTQAVNIQGQFSYNGSVLMQMLSLDKGSDQPQQIYYIIYVEQETK